jgi:hypothetical protein
VKTLEASQSVQDEPEGYTQEELKALLVHLQRGLCVMSYSGPHETSLYLDCGRKMRPTRARQAGISLVA